MKLQNSAMVLTASQKIVRARITEAQYSAKLDIFTYPVNWFHGPKVNQINSRRSLRNFVQSHQKITIFWVQVDVSQSCVWRHFPLSNLLPTLNVKFSNIFSRLCNQFLISFNKLNTAECAVVVEGLGPDLADHIRSLNLNYYDNVCVCVGQITLIIANC